MSEGPLQNGHDKSEDGAPFDAIEAAHSVMLLKSQVTELQITAARNAERATIEALVQDAMRRYVEARKANNLTKEVEAVREILRLELYLSRRGFV